MSPARRDLALSLAFAVAAVVGVGLRAGVAERARLVSAGAAVALVVLAWRRTRPLAATVGLAAALVLQAALGGVLVRVGVVPLAAVAVAAYSLGSHASRGRAFAGAVVAACGLTLANRLGPATHVGALDDLVFFSALVIAAPLVIGRVLRARAAAINDLRARTALLAREEQAALRAARSEERSLLARAVHEAVAQRVGEIALQAGAAERIAQRDPGRALEALGAIETAARASLEDIRDVIGTLREAPRGAA